MIRMSRLADYGMALLLHAARPPQVHTARELAVAASLPLPTASKVLKVLAKGGVLCSQRGVRGGYRLARPAAEISVVDVLRAVDGLPALTQCNSRRSESRCSRETICPTRRNWRVINETVMRALAGLSLADMAEPVSLRLIEIESPRQKHEVRGAGAGRSSR